MKSIKLDTNFLKYFLYTLFIAGILFATIIPYTGVYFNKKVIELIFSLSLAGLVGIGTNTIAIKMLFRPLEKTFFGRQGLIPKNKEKIAKVIAEAVRDRIINIDSLTSHILENNLDQLPNKVANYLKDLISQPEIKQELKKIIIGFKDDLINEDTIKKVTLFIENTIEKHIEQETFSFEALFKRFRLYIRQNQNKNSEIAQLVKIIVQKLITDNSEIIAEKINILIDNYLANKNFLLYLGKQFFVSGDEIVNSISRFIEDEESLTEAGDLLEEILKDLDNVVQQPEIVYRLKNIYTDIKRKAMFYLKTKQIPSLIQGAKLKLLNALEDEQTLQLLIEKVEKAIAKAIDGITRMLRKKTTPSTIRNLLTKFKVDERVYNLVYTNIMKQSLEEFEELLQKIMSENLAYIEVVGGLLGMFIGFSLQYRITLIIFPSVIVLFLFIDSIFTKLFLKKRDIV